MMSKAEVGGIELHNFMFVQRIDIFFHEYTTFPAEYQEQENFKRIKITKND